MRWKRQLRRAAKMFPAPTPHDIAWSFTPDTKLDNIITILEQSRWVMD